MFCYTVGNLKVQHGLDLSVDGEGTPCLWMGDKAVCLDEEMLRVQADYLQRCRASNSPASIHAAQLQRRHFDSFWLSPSKGEEWLEGWQAKESPVLVLYSYECRGRPVRTVLNGGAKLFDHVLHKGQDAVFILCRMAIGDSIDLYHEGCGRLLATLRYDGQNFFESHDPSKVDAVWVRL